MATNEINERRMDAYIPDNSDPEGDHFEALSRDKVPVRSVRETDLDDIVRIDGKLVGRERRDFFQSKMREIMSKSGIRISLVAEVDNHAVGFIMARVDYGEFGKTEATAVIDLLGVHPGFSKRGVGSALMSQLQANLDALRVERIRTNVSWNNFSLLAFLEDNNFRPSQRLVLRKRI